MTNTTKWALCVVFAVGGLLRFSMIGIAPMTYDELDEQHMFQNKTTTQILTTPRQWPPVAFLPRHVANLIWERPSPVVLRSEAAVCGTLTILATAILAWMLLGDTVALWAAVLVAGNPYLVAWSTAARVYSLTTLAAVCMCIAFVWAVRRNDRRGWIVYVAVCVVACHVHQFLTFVVAAHVVAVFLGFHLETSRRHLVSAVVVALSMLPWVIYSWSFAAKCGDYFAGHAAWVAQHNTATIASCANAFFDFAPGATLTWTATAMCGLAIIGAFTYSHRWRSTVLLCALVVVPILGILGVINTLHYWAHPRHFGYVIPFVLILCAMGIRTLCATRLHVTVAILCIGAMTMVTTQALAQSKSSEARVNGDYRDLSSLLDTNMQADDAVLCGQAGWRFVLDYYGSYNISTEAPDTALAKHPRLWIVEIGVLSDTYRAFLHKHPHARLAFQKFAAVYVVPRDGDVAGMLAEIAANPHPDSVVFTRSLGATEVTP